MNKVLYSLLFATLLVACGDSGVIIDDSAAGGGGQTGSTGSSGASSGGSNGSSDSGGTAGGTTGSGSGNNVVVEPPSVTVDTNLDPLDLEASRFLNQVSFGATDASIANYRSLGSRQAWIDAQFALPVSTTRPYTQANSGGSIADARHEIWWRNALLEPDQLRQRVAFALSQIFVVSDIDYALSNAQYGMTHYYDMLASNAFGNYRQLLEKVTLHPVMGVYLSMVLNEKANAELHIRPDENYAREVLQLFSIGLFELNLRGEPTPAATPRPAYSQQNIEEFARVFTGWNYGSARYWNDNNPGTQAYLVPMVATQQYHDTGSKNLLNGTVSPAGLSAEEDMQFALDNIFQHPNVGPFIGKQLIQRLITSNPTPEYVERVAQVFNNNGAGVRGDLGAVVRAILLDEEARSGYLNLPDFGKLREPNIKFAHFWRALSATPGPKAQGVHNTADFQLYRMDEMGGQAVMKSPSVFNFYHPQYGPTPENDLLLPEMEIMTEANLANTHINYHHHIYRFNNRADLSDDSERVTIINLEPLALKAANPDELIGWYNLIFFSGDMPDAMRTTLKDYMATLDNSASARYAKAQDTLFMVMTSPAFHVQR